MVLISALASTLSIEAFSTFKIFPLKGRIAWVWRFLLVFAEPPALSPSTMKISHSSGVLEMQLASFPLESKLYLDLDKRFTLAFSSCFRILADFSAQERMAFTISRFLSKYRSSSSPTTEETSLAASKEASLVLVCPSKTGSGYFTESTATIPFLVSAPVKLGSFSFKIPSCLA